MTAEVDFYWNDTALLAAGPEALALAANDVRARAAALAQWPNVRSGIHAVGAGNAWGIISSAPEGRFLEGGTAPHTEETTKFRALKFKTGGFARGPVPHPGTEAHPFMEPAVATFPAAFQVRARETFPKG